jgi:hypothetical protein
MHICLAVHRPPEPELVVTGGVHDFASIRELPLTCLFDIGPIGRGRLRPMQINALTASEQIKLLNAAHESENPVIVIVTHPFEFVKKRTFRHTVLRHTDLRRNRMTHRFQRLCAFLSANTDKFEVVPLVVAANAVGDCREWTELTGHAFDSAVRAVANCANDRLNFN